MAPGRSAKVLASAFLAISLLACGGPPPRAPNPTKPLDERRAVEIIAKGVRKEKAEPEEGRDVKLTSGALVHVDVGVSGKKYGVAYLTENDLSRDDADRLPKKDPKRPRALVLAEGGSKDDTGAKILLLFDRDYLYDDHVGGEHEQTSITAEAALERDVRDFVVQAKAHRWE
jgi:hypothetical protein